MSQPPWGQSAETHQGQSSGPINFYDPTKFQANSGEVPVNPSSQQGPLKHEQGVAHQSWGTNSWDFNPNQNANFNGNHNDAGQETVNPTEQGGNASQWSDYNSQWSQQQYWQPSPEQQWQGGQYAYNQKQYWTGDANSVSQVDPQPPQVDYHSGQFDTQEASQPHSGTETVGGSDGRQFDQHEPGHGHQQDQGFNSVPFADNNGEGGLAGFFHGSNETPIQDGFNETNQGQAGSAPTSVQELQNHSPRTFDGAVPVSDSSAGPQTSDSAGVIDTDRHSLSSNAAIEPAGTDQMSHMSNIQGTEISVPSFNVHPVPNQSQNETAQPVGTVQSGVTGVGIVPDRDAALGDWDLVPPPHGAGGPTSRHSREASLDENVQFFIGSANSSTRVSPSNPVVGTEFTSQVNKVEQSNLPQSAKPENQTECKNEALTQAPPRPPSVNSHPPMRNTNNPVENPFRRTPVKPGVGRTTTPSNGMTEPMLSSTQLDITKPNFENSPVVLNESISPIPTSPEGDRPQQTRTNTDTPHRDEATHDDDPIPQSPILSRKESPFQPPSVRREGDLRLKPVKGVHDIPGVKNSSDTDVKQPAYLQDRSKRSSVESERDHKDYGLESERRENDRLRGRRTPDWDSAVNKGRKTPDWERAGSRGRKTPDWDTRRAMDSTEEKNDRGYRESDVRRKPLDKDSVVSTRPPIKPSSNRDRAPVSRQRQSAFHQITSNRSLHNMSPATTLWDTELSVASNIILVQPTIAQTSNTVKTEGPAGDKSSTADAPSVLTPVASLITSMSEQIKTDDPVKPHEKRSASPPRNSNREETRQVESNTQRSGFSDRSRTSARDQRNYDRGSRENLSHIGRDGSGRGREDSKERYRGNSVERERDRYDRDGYRERDRADYSDRSYRDRDREKGRYRDQRPPSRTGSVESGYSRRDPRDPYRDPYKDPYSYRDERYERPRSRHDENRPASRHGDVDRPRSRTDYDREQYYRDRYRGYNYDEYYSRGGQYYDQQYYDYYNQYNQGYYDEMGYYHGDQYGNRYLYPPKRPNADPYGSRARSRVSTPGSLSDGGEEIVAIGTKKREKNGSTSANEDNSKTKAGGKERFNFPPDLHDYSGRGGYDESYYNYYNGQYQTGHYGYDDRDVSSWVQETEVEPQRQTPEKFMIPHMKACFGPSGQMVKVLPNRPTDGQPATLEIHEVSAMIEDTPESMELREFPGPLVRGDTHKNDVLLFCQKKTRSCQDNLDLNDRESAELIWKLLELLIKQNGTVVGTDIADLLLEGHEPTTLDYKRSGMRIATSMDNLDNADTDEVDATANVTADRSMVNRSRPVEEVTDRFRHLLLYGRKRDALEWAMKNNLWGHALFLASKMDSRAHANVMTRFANVAMRMNDPLQTLYQLMSARQPAAVTCVTEERWGDWRPHLAMILSNHTSRPDLDRKSITTLGDTLAGKGYLHASHFCYLMSQTSFGSYNKKSSKLVLIGSSHSLPLEIFASNEAIQCTEVYEYALALGNTSVSMVNFQYFKYLYATRLAECGLSQEALSYCEVISRAIQLNPTAYQPILVKLLFTLASQLKFSDPRRHEGGEETEDPEWLMSLQRICQGFQDGSIQPASGTVTPMYMGGTTASSESGEVATFMQEHAGMPAAGSYGYGSQEQQYGNVDQEFTAPLNSIQEQPQYQEEASQPVTEQQYQQNTNGYVFNYNTNQWEYVGNQQTGGHVTEGTDTANQSQAVSASQQTGYDGTTHGYSSHQNQTTTSTDLHQKSVQSTDNSQNSHTNWQNSQPVPTLNSQFGGVGGQRGSLASTVSEEVSEDGDELGESMDSGQNPNIFDICQPNRQSQIIPPRLRKRTVSGSSAGSTGSSATAIHKPSSSAQKQNSDSSNSQSLGDQAGQKGKAGSGLFGGFLNMFKPKGKNEMKLPDDKKPSIVWDNQNKRWVDLDKGEEEETPAAPPPKDTDLLGSSKAKPVPSVPTMTPAMSQSTQGTGVDQTDSGSGLSLAGNRFSRPKGRGARSQYVDIMNPKPAGGGHVPTSLFNTLPSSASAPAIFVPGGQTATEDPVPSKSSTEPVSEAIPEERTAPTSQPVPGGLHLPTREESSLSRTSSMSSLSLEVQKFMSKGSEPVSNVGGPGDSMGGPMMFDPAQFQSNTSFKQPQGGRRLLGSRRVYPK